MCICFRHLYNWNDYFSVCLKASKFQFINK